MSDTKKKNLFDGLAKLNKPPISETEPDTVAEVAAGDDVEETSPPSPALPEVGSSNPSSRPRSTQKTQKKEEPKGKRGRKDYVQANAYVPKVVRKEVDKQLIDMEGMDYSTLVTELLTKWLKSRGVSV